VLFATDGGALRGEKGMGGFETISREGGSVPWWARRGLMKKIWKQRESGFTPVLTNKRNLFKEKKKEGP